MQPVAGFSDLQISEIYVLGRTDAEDGGSGTIVPAPMAQHAPAVTSCIQPRRPHWALEQLVR